uniref:Uncharacterized protein n=1 Tax=Glossina brevipalpis TaxID=37001 RepID=A0A1A9W495_9MUSC
MLRMSSTYLFICFIYIYAASKHALVVCVMPDNVGSRTKVIIVRIREYMDKSPSTYQR